MREFPQYDGAMADWPRVEAMPGAAELLFALSPDWKLALATNAVDSDEAQIRQALKRVNLDRYLDSIYCYRKIGHKKPAAEFYHFVINDLGLPKENIVMVGDDFAAEIIGATKAGLRAIWYLPNSSEERQGSNFVTIHDLLEIPGVL